MLVSLAEAGKKKKEAEEVHPLTNPIRVRLNHQKYVAMLKERDQDWLSSLSLRGPSEGTQFSNMVMSLSTGSKQSDASFDFDYKVTSTALSAGTSKLIASGKFEKDGQTHSYSVPLTHFGVTYELKEDNRNFKSKSFKTNGVEIQFNPEGLVVDGPVSD